MKKEMINNLWKRPVNIISCQASPVAHLLNINETECEKEICEGKRFLFREAETAIKTTPLTIRVYANTRKAGKRWVDNAHLHSDDGINEEE
uniref:Uncharacterized protein n=1 Tax=Romanomermis culicivorax TaxID=13658 RepID=A0A915ICB8_ROMCU